MTVATAIRTDCWKMPARRARLGANGIKASVISALMIAQTTIWLVIVGRPRRAALQGFGKPVEAVTDRLMRNVLGRMSDRGRIEHPCATLCDVAIDLAGFDRPLGAEHRPEFWALRHIAGAIDAPHQV